MNILIAGATGFLGGELLKQLSKTKHSIRCLVRKKEDSSRFSAKCYIAVGDLLDLDSLYAAAKNIDIVYCLVHTMGIQKNRGNLLATEKTAALNLAKACRKNNVKRIIYMSGLMAAKDAKSEHLKGRWIFENEIINSGIQYTIFRAGMIIGMKSLPFRTLYLTAKYFPIIFLPKWAKTKMEPVALDDVLFYLIDSLKNKKTINKIIEIGVGKGYAYEEILGEIEKAIKKRRPHIILPFYLLRSTALYISILANTPYKETIELAKSLKIDMYCRERKIKDIFKREPLDFGSAIRNALSL
ncbi:MAG: NAD(P)H-binding protein [Candidatus Woesearchaeota archaeon]|nr:NAD(P)H-binding protein [Candidatus Woesearchaeota archaeon]